MCMPALVAHLIGVQRVHPSLLSPPFLSFKNLIWWVPLVVSCLVGWVRADVLNPPGSFHQVNPAPSPGPSMSVGVRTF